MTARDRRVRVTGQRREHLDAHRIAGVLMRLARSGGPPLETTAPPAGSASDSKEEPDDTPDET